jgi:hypothetical protein
MHHARNFWRKCVIIFNPFADATSNAHLKWTLAVIGMNSGMMPLSGGSMV